MPGTAYVFLVLHVCHCYSDLLFYIWSACCMLSPNISCLYHAYITVMSWLIYMRKHCSNQAHSVTGTFRSLMTYSSSKLDWTANRPLCSDLSVVSGCVGCQIVSEKMCSRRTRAFLMWEVTQDNGSEGTTNKHCAPLTQPMWKKPTEKIMSHKTKKEEA